MSFAKVITIQRLCVFATLTLITIGAYLSVGLFYQLIDLTASSSQSLTQPAASNPTSEMFSVQPVSYYNPILERDLFSVRKSAQARVSSASLNPDNLQKTQLNLKLWGTVSGDPQTAYAVIEDTQRREQNLFRIGDSIQNATIKMILRGRVVLNVEGRDEVLSMEETEQASPSLITSPRRRGAYFMSPPPPAREQRITLQRSMLNESFSDVNKLMTQIAISPHMEGGQPAGLSLSRIAPNSIFRRMGLRNGDVLLGVNGQQILSTDDAMRMYESLKSSNEVQLQIKRRGQERTVHYYIR